MLQRANKRKFANDALGCAGMTLPCSERPGRLVASYQRRQRDRISWLVRQCQVVSRKQLLDCNQPFAIFKSTCMHYQAHTLGALTCALGRKWEPVFCRSANKDHPLGVRWHSTVVAVSEVCTSTGADGVAPTPRPTNHRRTMRQLPWPSLWPQDHSLNLDWNRWAALRNMPSHPGGT